jgi:predicted Zn-dependent protease
MMHLSEWGQLRRDQQTERTLAFHAASLGQAKGQQTLQEIALSEAQPAIWRASAINALVVNNKSSLTTLQLALTSSDPLIRQSAVRQAGNLPDNLKNELLLPLLGDEDLSVRLTLAFALAGIADVNLSKAQAQQLRALDTEYRAIADRHLDQAEQHLSLGDYETRQGNIEAALSRYQRALTKNPQLLAAYINKADVEANSGNNQEAISTLERGLTQIADNPDLAFALGLAHIRAQDYDQGLTQLARAAKAESARYRFTYAIALHGQGKLHDAIKILKGVSRKWPNNEEALQALAQFAAEADDTRTALEAVRQLTELAPNNRQYQVWRQQLERSAIAR